MKSPAWSAGPHPRGSSGMNPIPHSGGEGTQLAGYDASNRVAAKANGGTRTADVIAQPGKHVPREKPWKTTPPDHFEPVAEYGRAPKDRSY